MNILRLGAIAVAVLAVGLGFLGWTLGISPILAQASTADQQTELVVAENAVQAGVLAELKSDFEFIDEARADLNALQLGLPDTVGTSEIASLLGSLADQSQVLIKAATIGEAVPYGNTEVLPEDSGLSAAVAERMFVVPVTVTIEGPSANAFGFLAGLQSADRIVFIDRVTSNDATGGTPSIDFSGFAYVLVDPVKIATDAAAKVERIRAENNREPETSSDPTPVPTETPTP